MPNSAPCQIRHPPVLVGLGVGVGEGLGLGVGLGLGNQGTISMRECIIWQISAQHRPHGSLSGITSHATPQVQSPLLPVPYSLIA